MKKTIVITGASRGIGKAIAIELAGKDTNIVINCVNNVDKLNGVKSIIEEKGSVCETFIGDMGNYSDVQKMFDMCLQRFGQVDVLINNAGISVVGLFQDMGENEWHRICNTNIDSVFNCCHFAVKDMMKGTVVRLLIYLLCGDCMVQAVRLHIQQQKGQSTHLQKHLQRNLLQVVFRSTLLPAELLTQR